MLLGGWKKMFSNIIQMPNYLFLYEINSLFNLKKHILSYLWLQLTLYYQEHLLKPIKGQ